MGRARARPCPGSRGWRGHPLACRRGPDPGAAGFVRETHALEMDNVEVLLVGETREWETVEYAADAVTEGRRKALIVIGHVPSEQAGMEECARWLKTFVKDVPVEFVPAKQPFWTLEQRKVQQ